MQTESKSDQRGKRAAAFTLIGFLSVMSVAGWYYDNAHEQYKFSLPLILPAVLFLFGADVYQEREKLRIAKRSDDTDKL